MNFEIVLYIYIYIVWIIYVINSLIQNYKMRHFLPNKKIELLTIPFYILALFSFYVLDKRLADIFLKDIYVITLSPVSLILVALGVLFLLFSVILYFYLNFFTESFPSCMAMKNNKPLTGIYKYVRHPSCYTFIFITFGTALCLQNYIIFWLAVINLISIYFYYIIEENQIKKTNSYYAEYLKKTNRVLPNFLKFR